MDSATLENLIVKEIRIAKEISRRDLADRLSIAKSTAGRRVDNLIERGIVRETGIEDRKEVGRPRRFLALEGDAGAFVGFDFDARHIHAVLIDFNQETIERKKVRLSEKPDRDEILGILRTTIAEFRSHPSCIPLRAIGIGAPGHVRRAERVSVHYRYIEGWRNVALLEELELDPEVLHLENNTRAIALGEYWLGHFAASPNLVCISVRTGVSSAVVANGSLLVGSREMAGEIRGWPVSGDTWLEQSASVRAVIDGESPGSDRWVEFVSACREGDADALATLETVAGHHADAAARMVQLLDPEAVFFAGPFIELESLYFDPLRAAVASALEGNYFTQPPILPVSLGEYAGAHGAAALAAAETPMPQ